MQIAIDYTLFLVRTALPVLSAIGLNSILKRSHVLADRYNQENVEMFYNNMLWHLFSSFLHSTAIQAINVSSTITDIIPNIRLSSQNIKTRFLRVI